MAERRMRKGAVMATKKQPRCTHDCNCKRHPYRDGRGLSLAQRKAGVVDTCEGVQPWPKGRVTSTENIEPGQQREEVPGGGLTKLAAIGFSRELLAKMKGNGWVLRVWQNLGWHFSVRLGDTGLEVYPSLRYRLGRHVNEGYRAMWNGPWSGAGLPTGRTWKNPNQAAAEQARLVEAHIEACMAALRNSENVIGDLSKPKRRAGR